MTLGGSFQHMYRWCEHGNELIFAFLFTRAVVHDVPFDYQGHSSDGAHHVMDLAPDISAVVILFNRHSFEYLLWFAWFESVLYVGFLTELPHTLLEPIGPMEYKGFVFYSSVHDNSHDLKRVMFVSLLLILFLSFYFKASKQMSKNIWFLFSFLLSYSF